MEPEIGKILEGKVTSITKFGAFVALDTAAWLLYAKEKGLTFDGLIPEGWLLNIAENNWKINQRDRMSLLLACCKDCIGAVSVISEEEE